MNIEEAIKVLNNFNPLDCGREDTQAIETLLTAYEKEKIEEMKKQLDLDIECEIALNSKIMDLEKEIEELKEKAKRQWVLIKENGKVEPLFYVSEDKIKAKIQECREILYSFEKELELKANKEKYINKESMNCLLSQISILQSLLEKE